MTGLNHGPVVSDATAYQLSHHRCPTLYCLDFFIIIFQITFFNFPGFDPQKNFLIKETQRWASNRVKRLSPEKYEKRLGLPPG